MRTRDDLERQMDELQQLRRRYRAERKDHLVRFCDQIIADLEQELESMLGRVAANIR
jgi:cell division protein ZapA (FtsZ GTPase activity inhibitor)